MNVKKWSWRLGSLAGIPVYVHATFTLLLGWIALMHWMGGGGVSSVVSGLIFVLSVNSDALRNEGLVMFMAAMSLLVSLSNMGFNYVLIGLLDMGVAGSAYGTALAQSLAVILRRRPAAVLGMGGFVSGPGGVAAWLTRRPLVIHEQNAAAGLTNRLLARLARVVLQAFPGSFNSSVSAETVGNPVREDIAAVAGILRESGVTEQALALAFGEGVQE